jgi:hypothetical protein
MTSCKPEATEFVEWVSAGVVFPRPSKQDDVNRWGRSRNHLYCSLTVGTAATTSRRSMLSSFVIRGCLLKIVLSRKGFDSASGGAPSPILPTGKLVPLPIPATRDPHTYDEITINQIPLGALVEDLTRIERTCRCHLDPDLDAGSLPRLAGWRPAFGQIDAAQSHLARYRIGVGDLFLFFGWFRVVEQIGSHWRYVRKAPDLHVIYGWMQVGEVIALAGVDGTTEHLAPFADHPHLHGRDRPSNTLYLAADCLDLPRISRPGGGIFSEVSDSRILTDIHQSKRSTWKLPEWFHPSSGTALSYNEKPDRWEIDGTDCILSSAARGQEFVLTHTRTEAAELWLQSIFHD